MELQEASGNQEVIENQERSGKGMRILELIEDKVAEGEELNPKEREFLVDSVVDAIMETDDPKYYDSNKGWLQGLSDKDLLAQYNKYN